MKAAKVLSANVSRKSKTDTLFWSGRGISYILEVRQNLALGRGPMEIFMLDTNIFDKIIGNEGLKTQIMELKNKRQVAILTTHIQIDELSATSDVVRRKRLLECASEICEFIPTMGFVLDVSRLDMARLSNGGEIERIRQGNSRRTQDALIAATASSGANFLITEDHSFATRAKKNLTNVKVLNFRAFVRGLNVMARRCLG